ncbi:MAG: 50S ribosomal protein L21 [Magnetococcales bacterium]|nr:50S ribosomal protein L21 [Magnetococcales bacterium]NGZ27831.1 50S ribosomal protein L21 [Magnetococcales bacterium]
MYAVVRTGGKQYKVAVNDVVRVEKLLGEPGDAVSLNDILLVSDSDGILRTGDAVAGASVSATILRQDRDKKILIFKKRRRKNSRRRQGHRQYFTELKITSIQ